MKKTDGDIIAESISLVLGRQDQEIKVGLSTVGHVRELNGKYHASARVSNDEGTKEIDKHIGVYDSYAQACDKILQMRNVNLFVLPDASRIKDK
jgi:hypothetical protein